MNYLPKFYSAVEDAVAMRDAAVKILNDLDDGPQKERLQEDIWDLNDIISDANTSAVEYDKNGEFDE